METVKNQYDIQIVKCCASCKHNGGVNNEYTRICEMGMGIVKPSFCCKMWKMQSGLNNAGRGDGKIHKHEYNMFMLDAFNDRNNRLSNMPSEARLLAEKNYPSPEDFAKEWEKENGSRYINI